MTHFPNTSAGLLADELLPCPMGCIGEVIGGEHEGACVYCAVCHLRAVSPKAWNTRQSAAPASEAAIERWQCLNGLSADERPGGPASEVQLLREALRRIATVDMGGGFLGAQACRKVAAAALAKLDAQGGAGDAE